MIFCFSGNGNSLMVADELSRRINENVIRITAATPLAHDASEWRRVVWVFPVYSWGMPEPIVNFISHVVLTNLPQDATHHLVVTCGDDTGLVHLAWRKAIARRGWKAKGTYSVTMPNTYVTLPGFDIDSLDTAVYKIGRMPERVNAIARAIRHNARVDDVHRGDVPALKSRVLYPLFMRFLTSARYFHASDACVSCGLCEKGCPVNNISLNSAGRPEWSNHCAMCLRCYHRCPTNAISYGRFTKGKGQYPGPEATERIFDKN